MGPIVGARDNPKIFEDKITRWHNPSVVMDTLDHCHPTGGVKKSTSDNPDLSKTESKTVKNFPQPVVGASTEESLCCHC